MTENTCVKAYLDAYVPEAATTYPQVDKLEEEMGFAAGGMLTLLALPLATPLKKNPPNWQHGRVIFTYLSAYIRDWPHSALTELFCLDIGTAKGFSAAAMGLALYRQNQRGRVLSIDKLDPAAPVKRNTFLECENGPAPLLGWIKPWLPGGNTNGPILYDFRGGDSLEILFHEIKNIGRINFAFVDGAHEYRHVYGEGELIATRQKNGDIAIFDDLQMREVSKAVSDLRSYYDIRIFQVLPTRAYAIGRRK